MSSIASNSEDLILNADGGSSTVKFKIDGTEKASISSAGAFTSTTIDATKLTGALPAISGAALTGVGVAGITSAADATAITINSSENVGIGQTSPSYRLHVETSVDGDFASLIHNTDADNGQGLMIRAGADSGEAILSLRNQASSEKFKVLADGRGLSQFTAKAWCNFGMESGSIRDSHNISSITDNSTGNFSLSFSNNMANANYAASALAGNYVYSKNHWDYVAHSYNYATNHFRVTSTNNDTDTLLDTEAFSVIIFGD